MRYAAETILAKGVFAVQISMHAADSSNNVTAILF
jgi:hypothetical protein